jgi:hypothetical protein
LIGVIFSLNSIILWFSIYMGFEPDISIVSPERLSRITKFSYLWGDLAYISGSGFGTMSRAVGFFEVPSRYGNFMIFPAFLSYGYYVLKKRNIYLFASILCFITILLTFSLTVLLAVIVAIFMNIYFVKANHIKQVKNRPFLIGIVGLLLSLILIYGIFIFFQSQYSPGTMLFRAGVYESLFRGIVHMSEAFIPDLSLPFGKGMAYMRNGVLYTPQYGFVRWVMLLGYPGLTLILFFMAYMFKVHVFPALINKQHRIERYVALAFVGQTICDIEEGFWLSTFYLFTVAILVLSKRYEFQDWKSMPPMTQGFIKNDIGKV